MKKFYFFIMLSFVLGNFVLAQDSIPEHRAIDTLKVTPNESGFSNEQLHYINEMALNRSEKNMDRALDILQIIVAVVSIIFGVFSLIIVIIGFLGFSQFKDVLKEKGKLELKINKLSDEILQVDSNLNNRIDNVVKNKMLLDKVEVFWKMGNFDEAVKSTYLVEDNIKDDNVLINNYMNRASIFLEDSNPSKSIMKAIDALKEAHEINPNNINILDIGGYCYLLLVNSEVEEEKRKSFINNAEYCFNKILTIEEERDLIVYKKNLSNFGFLKLELKDIGKALYYFHEAEKIQDDSVYVNEMIECGKNFCYWKTSDDDNIQSFETFKDSLKRNSWYKKDKEKLFRFFKLNKEIISKIN